MSEVFGYVKPSPHSQISDTAAAAQQKQAGLSGLDFGQSALHVKAEGIHPPAGQVLDSAASPAARTKEHGEGRCAEGSHPWRNPPNVYTSAQTRRSICCIRQAAADLAAKPPYYLRLGDREFLQVYSAVEHDRSRTRKAIGKGLAEPGDLRVSDPLWQILQDVMTRRMKGYRL